MINKVVTETLQYVDKVIVCDDFSEDNTISEAESAGAYVIKHDKNLGKGAALRSLFKFAQFSNADIIITLDGDGQFLAREIPKLIESIKQNKSDIVIGYRFDDTTDMPKYRKVGNQVLDKMATLASDLSFRDTQSGFRAYSKNSIDKIQFSNNGFGADSEILVDAAKKGLKISEEKVSVIYKTGGETSTKNPISHSSEVVVSLIELIAIKSPLKILGIPGIILIIIGIVFFVYMITLFNETRYFSIPFTLVSFGTLSIGLLLLLVSLLLFSVLRIKNK